MVVVSCCSCPKLVARQPKSPAGANEFLSMTSGCLPHAIFASVADAQVRYFLLLCVSGFYVSLHVES